jgi:hypothetical protein
VAKYFDPHFVMAVPAAGAAPVQVLPGFDQVLANLPSFPSGVVPAATPVPGAAGAPALAVPNLLTTGNNAESMAVGAALRTHFADPRGGGGPGPALHLVSFATNGQLSFW